MVQSAEAGQGMNPAADCRTTLDRAPRWGVFRQPQMRPILVVIADILSHEPLQMPVVHQNPAASSREVVLPRSVRPESRDARVLCERKVTRDIL
jgi:hypothetical protein